MIEWILSSSFLILSLLLLRKLLRNKISPSLQYALWLLVLIRLLCPVQLFESPVPLSRSVSIAEITISVPIDLSYINTEHTDMVELPPASNFETQTAAPPLTDVKQPAIPLSIVLKNLWGCGSILLSLWFLFVNLHFGRTLKKSRVLWSIQNQTIPVYVVDGIVSPCLFGLFHTAIYLTPQAVAPSVQTHHVILHEVCHYRHGDHIWSLLRSLCLVIFWWNPLVWIAASCSRQDGELCCDESVIRLCGDRLAYGKTLVDIVVRKSPVFTRFHTATTMFSEVSHMKERIQYIAATHRTRKSVMVIAALIAIFLTACTFTKPAETTVSQSDHAEITEQVQPAAQSNIPEVRYLSEDTWLDYADSSRILFHNSYGIFLYDRDAEEIITIMSFPAYFGTNTLWSPGVSEPAIQVTVSADGSSAMIFCRGQKSIPEITTYYLNLNTGELTQDVYGKIKTGSTSDFDALDLLKRTSGSVADGTTLYLVSCLILNNHNIGLIHTDIHAPENLYYSEYDQLGTCVATIPLFENAPQ